MAKTTLNSTARRMIALAEQADAAAFVVLVRRDETKTTLSLARPWNVLQHHGNELTLDWPHGSPSQRTHSVDCVVKLEDISSRVHKAMRELCQLLAARDAA